MTSDELKVWFEKARHDPKPCIVCNGKPHVSGVFMPDDSQKFGAREGKSRIVAYWLCRQHQSWVNLPHKLREIEDILERKLRNN